MWPSLPSAWLGTAPGTVSRVSSLAAAARLWGAAWASPQDWGPGRCARAPAVRSASSPTRAGPGPRCPRPWRARRAVSLPRSEWSGRSFLGLPRALSSGASRDDRASQRASSGFLLAREALPGRGDSLGRGVLGFGSRWGFAPALALSRLLPSDGSGQTSSQQHPVSPARPPSRLPFFLSYKS